MSRIGKTVLELIYSSPERPFLLITFCTMLLFNSCTKTRLGEYLLILDGTASSVQRNAFCCDTTGIYSVQPYHEEREIKITHMGKYTVEIDGNIWEKDGQSVSFESSYEIGNTPGAPKGGVFQSWEKYAGTIKSKKLMQGEFSKTDFSVVVGSRTSSTLIQGNFIIKKK